MQFSSNIVPGPWETLAQNNEQKINAGKKIKTKRVEPISQHQMVKGKKNKQEEEHGSWNLELSRVSAKHGEKDWNPNISTKCWKKNSSQNVLIHDQPSTIFSTFFTHASAPINSWISLQY